MKIKVKLFLAILVLFSIVIAESTEKQKTKWKGKIEKEKEIIVVKNPKKPVYNKDVFNLKEELSIGGAEGKDEYIFFQIRYISVSEDEKIYILDSKEAHVKVFDKNGKYLKTIGRPGQGPGELNRPSTISVSQNELMVHETRRLSFFSLDGEFLRNVSTKGVWALSAMIDSKGNIVVTEGLLDPDNVRYILKKFDSKMNLLSEIASSPAPDARKSFNPFMPVAHWLIDKDDNIVYGYPKNYELQIFNPEDKLIKKITKEYDPVKVTEKEKKKFLEDTPPQIRTRYDFSKYHSAYRRLFLDDEGRIFVRAWEKIVDEDIYYYDVFDHEGRYIVKIPLRTRPYICKKGKLYSIEEDEDGFQMVKKYKVTWKY